ncbi:MAG: hypothetical protein AAF765_16810 [Bacteroidota bacterium]
MYYRGPGHDFVALRIPMELSIVEIALLKSNQYLGLTTDKKCTTDKITYGH